MQKGFTFYSLKTQLKAEFPTNPKWQITVLYYVSFLFFLPKNTVPKTQEIQAYELAL